MQITGTFVNPVPGDIPAENWGYKEWDRELELMKKVGIDTLILLRTGWKEWLCYPSKYLQEKMDCFEPLFDHLQMYLTLCEKHEMKLFVGTYNSHHDWLSAAYDVEFEAEIIMKAAKEVWDTYGASSAFGGWYMTQEIARRESFRVVELWQKVAPYCKEISNGLPVLISPGMAGVKAGNQHPRMAVTLEEHRADWDWIFNEISGIVDIVAFQDGHVTFKELESFLAINSELAAKHGIECWTNAESFSRDISSTNFPPIHWEKLIMKLKAAERTGHSKAITFEFTPFMSPNGSYRAGRGLLERYCEYYEIPYKNKFSMEVES
jgi:hypothetical protein